MKRTLNGWHVLAIFGGCFGIIIAVNLTLAFKAVSTFPGLVTKNSYVASQSFDADRAAQDALGWTLETTLENDVLMLAITDVDNRPVRPEQINATLGRATHVAEDIKPVFEWDGTALKAAAPVEPGYWTLWLEITAEDGTPFRRRIPLTVEEAAS
ncbi:nitrogen fixation protein FixH [Sulfitobacter sp. JBTF-M27]|uniref:Nitrogen fixation protein FixH n=1 Tax=Sulfitobacter sediminilitoris TaxID=2698830 RepID=A0A6P0C8Z8_9RHOB|nr:FixH family protein [Sulfitobacter sediminilitoris]NEK21900.1 nitrogen fixation protein FixH [Sulfitobacter sediminilitoris]